MVLSVAFGFVLNEHIANDDSVEKQKILRDLKHQLDESINAVYTSNDMGRAISASERTNLNKTEALLNDKRSGTFSARWICNTTYNWMVLGDGFHPRFLKETVCVQTVCIRGHYSCQPYYYPVYILSPREVNDAFDIQIPRALRDEWKFTTVNLAVGCQCGSVL